METGLDNDNDFSPELDRATQTERQEPCVALFRAVIWQALADVSSRCQKPESRKAKNEAKYWFEHPNSGFDAVCEMAGYEPEYIRHCYRIAQLRSFFWRKPPENAPRSFPLSQRAWSALGALPPEFRHYIMRRPANRFGATRNMEIR